MSEIIETEEQYRVAMARIDDLMEAERGTAEGEELTGLVDLVMRYEEQHFPMFIMLGPEERGA